MFDRFTDGARDAVASARELARKNEHDQVHREHLLVALAQQDAGVAALALRSVEPSVESLGARLVAALGEGRSGSSTAPPLARATTRVLDLALREALQLGDRYIGTEHVLLELIRTDAEAPMLHALLPSVKPGDLRQHVTELLEARRDLPALGPRPGKPQTTNLVPPTSRGDRSGDSRFEVGPGCYAELPDGRRVEVIGVNALGAIATDEDGSRVLHPWPRVLSVTQPAV